jgi:SAM-dependent methyltransferase
LYTQEGATSFATFQKEPALFDKYHEGFREQVARWPVNPLDVMVRKVLDMPKSAVIADMGCGEAMLAASVPHKVHSFDLVAANKRITAADIADVPLPDASVDCVVFCLALMGTDYPSFLAEAARICKPGGTLHVAEVRSRVEGAGSIERDEAEDAEEAASEADAPAGRGRTKLSEEEAAAGLAALVDTIQGAGFAVRRVNRRNKMFLLILGVRIDDGTGHPPPPPTPRIMADRARDDDDDDADGTLDETPSSAGAKPAGAKPAGAKPAGAKPAGAKPAGAKPAGAKPTGCTGRSEAAKVARAAKRREKRRAVRAAAKGSKPPPAASGASSSSGAAAAATAPSLIADSGAAASAAPSKTHDRAGGKAPAKLKACIYKRR